MARPQKLTELQCQALREFDLLARIPLPRVAEFSYPFLVSSFSGGDEDQRVVILYKRILRLLSAAARVVSRTRKSEDTNRSFASPDISSNNACVCFNAAPSASTCS